MRLGPQHVVCTERSCFSLMCAELRDVSYFAALLNSVEAGVQNCCYTVTQFTALLSQASTLPVLRSSLRPLRSRAALRMRPLLTEGTLLYETMYCYTSKTDAHSSHAQSPAFCPVMLFVAFICMPAAPRHNLSAGCSVGSTTWIAKIRKQTVCAEHKCCSCV